MLKRETWNWNFKDIVIEKGKVLGFFVIETNEKFNIKHETSSTNNQKSKYARHRKKAKE